MIRFTGRAGERMGGTILPDSAVRAAGVLGRFHPCHLPAILDVECAGEGFLADGRPKILFEAHVFDRLTGGRFRAAHPTLSSAAWDRTLYWGGEAEYVRLEAAMALDETAALKACSWGLPQIMGENHAAAGFGAVHDMVAAFADSPQAHLDALVAFLDARGLDDAVRGWDWATFARGYNGPGYARNRYDLKLAVAAARHGGLTGLRLGQAGDTVRVLQGLLADAGFEPGASDGALGPRTAAALRDWQRFHRAPHPDFPRR